MNTNGTQTKPKAVDFVVPDYHPAPKIGVEPLYMMRTEKLYLHIDLLKGLEEFFKPTTDYTICGQRLSENWGEASSMYHYYRCSSIPKTSDTYIIDDVNYLTAIYLGELKKKEKRYISLITVPSKDCEFLKSEGHPTQIIIKIKHDIAFPAIDTYRTVNP